MSRAVTSGGSSGRFWIMDLVSVPLDQVCVACVRILNLFFSPSVLRAYAWPTDLLLIFLSEVYWPRCRSVSGAARKCAETGSEHAGETRFCANFCLFVCLWLVLNRKYRWVKCFVSCTALWVLNSQCTPGKWRDVAPLGFTCLFFLVVWWDVVVCSLHKQCSRQHVLGIFGGHLLQIAFNSCWLMHWIFVGVGAVHK